MEKALHDYLYINTGKEKLETYGSSDAMFLIEAANLHLDSKNCNNSPDTTTILNAFIYECINEFYQNRVSDTLLNKLNKILWNVRIQCLVENIENKLSAVHVPYIPPNLPPLVFGAYIFSNIVSRGWLENLKRCQNNDCLKFFLGRTNAKWCASSCGSKYRVKKMRTYKRALGYSEQWSGKVL